jgi:hypothetical protein
MYTLAEDNLLLPSGHLPMDERFWTVKQIDFVLNGKYLVAGGDQKQISMWTLPQGVKLPGFTHGSSMSLIFPSFDTNSSASGEPSAGS